MSQDRQSIAKGSWRWAAHVAELMAWATVAMLFLALHVSTLPDSTYRWGIGTLIGLAVWLLVFFHLLLFRKGNLKSIAWSGVIVDVAFAGVMYALLKNYVPSAQLIFVPVILATGLVGGFWEAIIGASLAVAAFLGVAFVNEPHLSPINEVVNAAIFLVSGTVAGLLARELRTHYRAEQQQQRVAKVVRHRLEAVLDAVDEAIVYRDRQGITRLVNRRAEQIFGLDSEAATGGPIVEVLRAIARDTEDPEGFMETFQQLRDDPELEIRNDVEQVLPERRRLKLSSLPAFDENDALVGRIDVYTDVTQDTRRAAEIERLLEQARRTAESYQRALLPESTPTLPRVSIVAHYVPAAGDRAICGDFYDFVSTSDGKVAFVLGDVVGIGPRAASDTALTRYTLRSLINRESDPGRLLDEMNVQIFPQCDTERFVRLLIGVLDPERAILTYANAGHVPPVVYQSEEGRVEWLSEGGLALGIEPDVAYKATRLELEPGDTLVFYTDGVTEASRGGRPYGQGKFSDLVSAYGMGTPGELAQALRRSVEAWVTTPDSPAGTQPELRDDIAILVCQIAPDRLLGEPSRELVLPNESAR
ncbi:MAG TPA: SpoIIE family protein phosphatase, partial [Actinomycetota bacterium]|nr:SpoIIE family protein phosphatase [Actinomycetota bacterium]